MASHNVVAAGSTFRTVALPAKTHIITVALEDYFHGVAFANVIDRRQWSRFETRFEQNTERALELLDQFNVKGTFFVMGWVAERRPDVVREVVRRGHEIASSGYGKKSFRYFQPNEFRSDLKRARAVLEQASGERVLGYRVADRHLGARDLWALQVLAEEGYAYDSSFSPSGRSFSAEPWRRYLYSQQFGDKTFWELPLPAMDILGLLVPVAGGNYFRQLPGALVKTAVDRWHRKLSAPFVLYFRVWDLDPDQPRISSASTAAAIRHYRNPEKVPTLLKEFLNRYRFTSAATYLRLESEKVDEQATAPVQSNDTRNKPLEIVGKAVRTGQDHRLPITVVVPCFNEDSILPYLANTLRDMQHELEGTYDVHYVFVDDGSQDGTWPALQRLFGGRPDCRLIRQPRNTGVAAAILAGIAEAHTEVVCSIDCDCTYDPRQLRHLVSMLQPGVDLVTASPYHPAGQVLKVPRWRLALSRGASLLYRVVLNQPLHTFTSCFRVYRRSAVVGLQLREHGFLGVAELLAQMAVQGSRIVERPATLEARVLGRSKMKIVRTVAGHLRLLSRLVVLRLVSPRRRHRRGLDWQTEPQSQEPGTSSSAEVNYNQVN